MTDRRDMGKIVDHEGSRILVAASDEDMKVLSSPQRQRIFKLLHAEGVPMHGKEIGDRLGMKAASAHFHLRKLEKIGAVKPSHTQVINGITARYYEASVDAIILGQDFLEASDDGQTKQKMLFIHNTFNANRDAFIQSLQQTIHKEKTGDPDEKRLHLLLDLKIYLSEEDAAQLQTELDVLFSKYADPTPSKKPHAVWLNINSESHTAC